MGILLERFGRLCRDQPGRLALWSRGEDRRLTFRDLADRELAWRSSLRPLLALEEAEGGAIGLALGNGSAFVELFLALRALGLVVAALDGALPLAAKLELAGRLGLPTVLHRDPPGDSSGLAPGWTHHALADGVFCSRSAAPCIPAPPGTALIKLTSGSTGMPLGACLLEDSLDHGIRQIVEGMEIDSDDRVLLAIPLSHSYGFDNGLLSLVAHGTPLILEPSFFPAPILRALRETGATFLPLVPPLVHHLAQVPWPQDLPLRKVICAGGVLAPEVAQRFDQASGRPVHNFFGSTETGGISFEKAPREAAALGTVGFPLPGVRIELDAEGRVETWSPANAVARFGESWPAELVPRPVATGDTGRFTPEGRLQLTGRLADILNIGGKKVAAMDVEAALRRLPGVRDAAVVGVDDVTRGERVVAFLVADTWPLDLQSLPLPLTPRELRRLDTLPITERGKLDRAALRQLAR